MQQGTDPDGIHSDVKDVAAQGMRDDFGRGQREDRSCHPAQPNR